MTLSTQDHQQAWSVDDLHNAGSLLRDHTRKIKASISSLGADEYDLMLPETHVLPLVIQPDETIEGIIYGHYLQETAKESVRGRGVLVATDKRVMLIDHKPLYLKNAEYPYEVVSTISFNRGAFAHTITLGTRVGNISIRSRNRHLATSFISALEKHIIKSEQLGTLRHYLDQEMHNMLK
ncbi:PH domain-containing protein [Patescibacteria group bacterium]|jgi:hypothetical protein|nr:PH domain-containing protein [Patescibacteria group bacterium]